MSAGRFASTTDVPVERSRAALETLLRRYGADQLVTGWEEGRAVIAFRIAGRPIRLDVPMPTKAEAELTRAGRRRHPDDVEPAREQLERARWRAVLLLVQSKLESAELGIETLDQAFLSNIVAGDGRTIGEHMAGQIEAAIRDGSSSTLLLPGRSK